MIVSGFGALWLKSNKLHKPSTSEKDINIMYQNVAIDTKAIVPKDIRSCIATIVIHPFNPQMI